ncbi:MAG: CGNR zinc finger domain-containing protein [Acidimicrobiia bacterium]
MSSTQRGRILRPPSGGAFRFDAGAVCLDFAHTGGEGELAVFETLHTPADLAAWLAEPPLSVPRDLRVGDGDLATTRRVRTAIWRAAEAQANGRPLPDEVRETLNAAAARPPLVPRLGGDGCRSWAAPVTIDQVLSTLAREMIDLLSGPLAARLRECAADDCRIVFADTSRPGTRRWCSMERCGNRHKIRAHRSRRRDTAGRLGNDVRYRR